MTHDFDKAIEDVNRWAKHVHRGGKITVDIMCLEPETLETIRHALAMAKVTEDLAGVLKEVKPYIEDARLVDLGALRDAQNTGYRVGRAKSILAETDALIDKVEGCLTAYETAMAKNGGM